MPRQSEFSQDWADYICGEIAAGRAIREICKENDVPCKSVVFK